MPKKIFVVTKTTPGSHRTQVYAQSLGPDAPGGWISHVFSQIRPKTSTFTLLLANKGAPPNFFLLLNMQNLATFLLMPISFSGTISRGTLTLRNCYFSFFTKKPVLKIFFTEEYVKFGHFFTKGNFFFGHHF